MSGAWTAIYAQYAAARLCSNGCGETLVDEPDAEAAAGKILRCNNCAWSTSWVPATGTALVQAYYDAVNAQRVLLDGVTATKEDFFLAAETAFNNNRGHAAAAYEACAERLAGLQGRHVRKPADLLRERYPVSDALDHIRALADSKLSWFLPCPRCGEDVPFNGVKKASLRAALDGDKP